MPRVTRRLTAQVLNRQRTRSRTLMVRGLSALFSIKQKKIRQRVLLPRGGKANARNLVATGLSLFEIFPARWFIKRSRGRGGTPSFALPTGTSVINRRATAGQPFVATMPSGHDAVFRRATPRDKKRKDTHLPISELMVDASRPGYRVRAGALKQLAAEFPAAWLKRMRGELKRRFGA